ncbi:MAG: hypothetical protein FWD03_05415, partial [Defluviitaleaceae bacterium]|nr:hypothetical protein [Defluviitaleaceae bacterium]
PTPENFTPALCGTYTLNADGYLNHDNETTPFIPTGDQLLLLQAGDSFIVDGGIITEVQLRGLKENHVYQLHSLLTRDMHMIGDVTAILPDSNITENWIFTIVDGAHLTLTRPTGISQHVKEINFTGDAGTLTLVSNALTLDIEASEDTSFVLRAGGTGIPFFTNPQVQIDGFIITQLSNDLSLTITDNYIMIDGNAHTQGTPDRNCLLNGVNC